MGPFHLYHNIQDLTVTFFKGQDIFSISVEYDAVCLEIWLFCFAIIIVLDIAKTTSFLACLICFWILFLLLICQFYMLFSGWSKGAPSLSLDGMYELPLIRLTLCENRSTWVEEYLISSHSFLVTSTSPLDTSQIWLSSRSWVSNKWSFHMYIYM